MEKINKKRVVCSVLYLLIGIFIIGIRFKSMFYPEVNIATYNFDRFLWCLSSAFIGFAALAFRLRRHPKSPFPEYITYYPLLLGVIASLVFSLCHIFQQTKSFIFYYLSFSLSFIFGFLVDYFFTLVTVFLSKKYK